MKINNLKRTCWVNKFNSYFTGVPNHKEKTFLSSTKRALILKLTWPNLEFFFIFYLYPCERVMCEWWSPSIRQDTHWDWKDYFEGRKSIGAGWLISKKYRLEELLAFSSSKLVLYWKAYTAQDQKRVDNTKLVQNRKEQAVHRGATARLL